MKQTIAYLTLSALLAACGSGAPADELGRKKTELDSLKTAYKAIGEEIHALDQWIAEHDTTIKKNLPSVTTLVLQPTRFEHFVQVHGNVKADKSADLFANMGGRVRHILVQKGDRVRSGQLLVDLDNDAIARQLDAALAGANLTQDVYEKQRKLWEQKIGSEVQYLQAKSQSEQAAAQVAALREQVRLSNVTAPFDGVVDDIMVSVGDMTSPMAPVARVVDANGATLEADVPESYLQRIKAGDPVLVEFPSLGDTLTASLSNVSRYINPTNRTFKVSVRMPAGGNAVRPNLLGVIHVRDLVHDSALVVPSKVVQEDVNGDHYVFVLETTQGNPRTKKVMVERVMDYKRNTMIRSTDGTNLVGSTIVAEGAKNVGTGQEVRVTAL
jgi:membrane fusion protein, multidrug efflux system